MTDDLIMLLSTDWFLPYWAEIGIQIDDTAKIAIQQGCRKIVLQILDGRSDYYLIDFSEERKAETASQFQTLIQQLGASPEVSATQEEWANLTHQQLSATWNCAYLNLTICSPNTREEVSELDPDIRAEIAETWKTYHIAASAFRDDCSHSKTDWDAYTQQILGGPATTLRRVIQTHRLRAFWEHLLHQLTSQQIQDLLSLYRTISNRHARQERPDLIPSYMK